MNTHEFMAELYKGVPPEKVTYLYTLPRKQCLAYPIGQMDQMLAKAQSLSAAENVYWGLHLTDTAPAAGTRASAATISCISFIHGEFDVKSTAHKEQALPDTLEDVLSFLHGLESPPSIIVQSGNGVHTYWLLESPLTVTDENREWVKRLLRGHEKHILQQGAEHSWKFDAVADLARILRVPGTLNHKSDPPKRVEVIEASLKRYPLSAFEPYAAAGEAPRTERIPFTPDPEQIGPAGKILERCIFMQHCRDDADTLSEPEWFAMITNIALTADGEEAVHTLSEPYADYSYEETSGRIRRALEQKKPHTCRYIRECLGHNCPTGGCGVKAPIVLAQYTLEDRVQQLMAKTLTAEDVLSEKTVALMAYAKEQMPLEYSRFKLKLRPLGVSIRDFERSVNHQIKVGKEQAIEFDVLEGGRPIQLPGINLHGAVEPIGYTVTPEEGIRRAATSFGEAVELSIAPEPVVISRKLENVDDGQERLEISFRRNGRLKSIRVPRSSVLQKNQIVRYADNGLPVNSGTSEAMVSYLAAYEAQNKDHIPCVRSIDRIGWVGKEFYPYCTDSPMELESDTASVQQMVSGLTQEGSFEEWLSAAEKVREGSVSRAILAGSFASPLLHWLHHRVFLTHVWHDSRGGKTASLKMALSVWGDPVRLLSSYHATAVGLERSCAAMKHLPFGLDELQALADKRMTVESIVYSLGNGFGKLRGAKDGGLQKTLQWRNIILSTGEMPLIRENSMDGVGSRVLELYGRPIADEATARELHQISERSYGHAGKQYISYLLQEVLSVNGELEALYRSMQDRLHEMYTKQHSGDPGVHFDNIAVLCLGDYLSGVSVFSLAPDDAWEQAMALGMALLENNAQLQAEDSIQRAWDFTVDWIGSNKDHFRSTIYRGITRYGSISTGYVNLIQSVYRKALEDAGFSYAKSIKGFISRGWFDSFTDADGKKRSQYQCKIDGVNMRAFRCRLEVAADDTCNEDFLN